MTRARATVLTAVGVVVVGVLVALGALYLDPARAAVGPMPGIGLALPADTSVLTGIDVRRFVASPMYKRYGRIERLRGFAELEEQTGINPERDVDRLLISGQRGMGAGSGAAVIVTGRFDRARVTRAIEARKGVKRLHEKRALYVFGQGTREASAVAFLEDDTLVLGTLAEVERTLGNHVNRRAALKENAGLVALLQGVRPGSTFWSVGDQSVLGQLPGGGLPSPGGILALPAVKAVVVIGDLDPAVAVEAVAHTADEGSAKQVADVLRGLVAFASLQAGQRPELQRLASSVSVTTEATRVRINANFTYELLDAVRRSMGAVSGGVSR